MTYSNKQVTVKSISSQNVILKNEEKKDTIILKWKESEQNISRPNRSWLKKYLRYFNLITVEPVTLLYTMAYGIQYPAEAALIYRRVCWDRFYDNPLICENLGNESYADKENLVQGDVAEMNMYAGFCASIPPIILTFIYGILSDQYSRKKVIAIPFTAMLFEVCILILMAVIPSLPTHIYLVAKLCMGLGGGWTTFFMAVQSYTAVIR